MGEAYIKGAYSTVIGHRSLGSHEHKEAPYDKLLLIWLLSKYDHYVHGKKIFLPLRMITGNSTVSVLQ